MDKKITQSSRDYIKKTHQLICVIGHVRNGHMILSFIRANES